MTCKIYNKSFICLKSMFNYADEGDGDSKYCIIGNLTCFLKTFHLSPKRLLEF